MSKGFCVEALEDAIMKYGRPEIINTRAANSPALNSMMALGTEHSFAGEESRRALVQQMRDVVCVAKMSWLECNGITTYRLCRELNFESF